MLSLSGSAVNFAISTRVIECVNSCQPICGRKFELFKQFPSFDRPGHAATAMHCSQIIQGLLAAPAGLTDFDIRPLASVTTATIFHPSLLTEGAFRRRSVGGAGAAPAGSASSAGLPGGRGTPPYGPYGPCAGSRLNRRSKARAGDGKRGPGSVRRFRPLHQNAAVERRKACALPQSARRAARRGR